MDTLIALFPPARAKHQALMRAALPRAMAPQPLPAAPPAQAALAARLAPAAPAMPAACAAPAGVCA